jgi:hypothetical protein
MRVEREEWRRLRHRWGDCIANVPEAIKDRYEREGPRLEEDRELGWVAEPGADDFESRGAWEAYRRRRAAS